MEDRNQTAALMGLTQSEAQQRLVRLGPNSIERAKSRTVIAIIIGTLKEPMFLFMILAAALYLFVGDLGEGAFLMAAACASMGLVVFQDARSERALNALRDLASPHAHVVRDGDTRSLPADQLVVGDLVVASPGERFPADAELVSDHIVTVDESALTGESVPATKQVGQDSALFAGTMIISGEGLARINQTGSETRIGSIGTALTGEIERTPLQETTGRLVFWLTLAAAIICLLIVAVYGLVRGDWVAGGLAGLTAAIALLPEEFPLVLAVFLAMGSQRLGRHQVLVRRAAVIETLGAVTLLCVDKTGTLTQNKMEVSAILPSAGYHEADILRAGLLSSALHPIDPMDKALRVAFDKSGATYPAGFDSGPAKAFPLSAGLLAVVQAWQSNNSNVWAAKGAPEAILELCALPPSDIDPLKLQLKDLATKGMRVLALAEAKAIDPSVTEIREVRFHFVGFVGFVDPLRPDVPAALAEARLAGIDVAMITGDFPETALALARMAGLTIDAGTFQGADIEALSIDALKNRVRDIRVFARVSPEAKLKLIEAFQADGHVVAMTGDGINDAPALERAHVGIAMGQRGTDVAREAADLVLLDDSFASIITGVRLGRRIFANLRKALGYVLAIHIPIAGLALLPVVFGMPPLLYPMHIVLLELIIDPVSSLVFEAEPSDATAMLKPPRSLNEPLFGKAQMLMAALQGIILFLGVLGVYIGALYNQVPEYQARGMGYLTLVVGNLVLALVDGIETTISIFDKRHWLLWIVALVVGTALALILYVPALAQIFKVAPLNLWQSTYSLGVAFLSGGWFLVVRLIRDRRQAKPTAS